MTILPQCFVSIVPAIVFVNFCQTKLFQFFVKTVMAVRPVGLSVEDGYFKLKYCVFNFTPFRLYFLKSV